MRSHLNLLETSIDPWNNVKLAPLDNGGGYNPDGVTREERYASGHEFNRPDVVSMGDLLTPRAKLATQNAPDYQEIAAITKEPRTVQRASANLRATGYPEWVAEHGYQSRTPLLDIPPQLGQGFGSGIHPELIEPFLEEGGSAITNPDGQIYSTRKGLPEVIEAHVEDLRRNWGYSELTEEHVMITEGGTAGIDLFYQLFARQGKTRIGLDVPCWPGHTSQPRELELKMIPIPQVLNMEGDRWKWQSNPEAVSWAYDPKGGNIDLLLTCNPSNPTGHLLTEQDIDQLAFLSNRHKVPILSDNAYRSMVYKGEYRDLATHRDLKLWAISIISASKEFNVTGLREAAFVCHDRAILESAIKLASSTKSVCANRPAQRAVYRALKLVLEGSPILSDMRDKYQKNLEVLAGIAEGSGLFRVCEVEGAYYLTLFATDRLEIKNCKELAWALARNLGVATVSDYDLLPNEVLDQKLYPRFIRIAACRDLNEAIEGMERIIWGITCGKFPEINRHAIYRK
ncbi:MAG: pyridoxal phosphate-dependent aminotransferase [Bdellovibrionales bacterium]|nr:pyridoxal phosphate-dependent aminotransferase [Bdellovibrionales bacterium]